MSHVKRHNYTQSETASLQRSYACKWSKCENKLSKKKILECHLHEHTREIADQFLEILLKDQAKALSVNAKQMRWHPLVIKWCLRLYSKSHLSYDNLRNLKVLCLPSGRTLSDYKNFDQQTSGLRKDLMKSMNREFIKTKRNENKLSQLGMLLFDTSN